MDLGRILSTGTGFPKVFYLTYHLYRNSFPLLALGGFVKGRMQGSDQALEPFDGIACVVRT